MSLAIVHANQLVCVSQTGQRAKCGHVMRDLAIIEDGAVLIKADKIVWTGPSSQLPQLGEDSHLIDARGKIVLPGLVDSHTHLVFAGDRAAEFEQRLQGASYQEIAAKGGGINSTVRQVRQASPAELKESAHQRLKQMLEFGITTVEVKSGYGLTLQDELKCLNLIAELNHEQPCELAPTFLGAHEIPPEYRTNRHEYIRLLCAEMIPRVATERLAEFCDVFCEQGVFSVVESERILGTAKDHGLKLKIHADEFTALGGTEMAARLGAVSADHLLHVTETGIQALKVAGTVATLLPGTAFFLGLAYAPARKLIDRGLPVAMATDCNPGSCMSENLPLMGTIACTQMKMLPAEVVSAMTLNAAAALGRSDRIGSIEPGKQADLVIFDVPSYSYLPYHFGVNHAWKVIKSGRVVVGA
ncbi:MAG TPA: imidazolonepropionase [Gemmataceae bacterium]|jgi:imidazolonepropionase|nr:imidazolonepropionase [Gemmataceae bacterium]